MRLKSVFFMLLLLLLVPGRQVSAAVTTVGPLMLADFSHWLDLSYQFQGQQQEATSTTRHRFLEDYNLKFKYALVRPSLLNGAFQLKLMSIQEKFALGNSSTDSNSIGAAYSLSATLFGKSPAPGGFNLGYQISEVSNPFSPSYLLKSSYYGVHWSLAHRILPTAVSYTTGTSETSGLPVDSRNDHDELTIHTSHTKGISTSGLEMHRLRNAYTPTIGAGTSDNTYDASFSNNLNWSRGDNGRGLGTSFSVVETSGINSALTIGINESLSWQFGKKLSSGVTYGYYDNTVKDASVLNNSSRQVNSANAWLRHTLFKSLDTSVSATARRTDYPTGYDQQANGSIALVYNKDLPRDSRLTLSAFDQYGMSERNLGSSLIHVLNEQHTFAFGTPILLVQPNVVASGITVSNANPLLRPTPYVLNVDYQIVPRGIQTEILPISTGAINNGDTLQISYDYLVDSNLKLRIVAWGAGGAVTLFGGKYRVWGDVSQTSQDPVGGQAVVTQLYSKVFHLGLDRRWDDLQINMSYENTESNADKHQTVSALGSYSRYTRYGYVSLSMRNLYQWYAPITTGTTVTARQSENNFGASASFRRGTFYGGGMLLAADYQNILGATKSDRLLFSASLNWAFRKLVVTFLTTYGIQRQEQNVSYSENVNLQLTRYF